MIALCKFFKRGGFSPTPKTLGFRKIQVMAQPLLKRSNKGKRKEKDNL